ncbi:hypothetical protein Mapa_015017 [Marchantia paleacea]|nr:hypothetical protein Mapa_015017 [Marchantia paleacea]
MPTDQYFQHTDHKPDSTCTFSNKLHSASCTSFRNLIQFLPTYDQTQTQSPPPL